MKKIFLLAVAVTMLAACRKNDDGFHYREMQIWLNVENDGAATAVTPKGVLKRNNRTDWTIEEIVRNNEVYLNFFEGTFEDAELHKLNNSYSVMWFNENLRDTINNRLMLDGAILDTEGNLIHTFLSGLDFLITIYGRSDAPWLADKCDTIGYIPNAAMREIERKIDSLHALGKYDEIYDLYHTAYYMRLCTGAEYKALKARGEN